MDVSDDEKAKGKTRRLLRSEEHNSIPRKRNILSSTLQAIRTTYLRWLWEPQWLISVVLSSLQERVNSRPVSNRMVKLENTLNWPRVWVFKSLLLLSTKWTMLGGRRRDMTRSTLVFSHSWTKLATKTPISFGYQLPVWQSRTSITGLTPRNAHGTKDQHSGRLSTQLRLNWEIQMVNLESPSSINSRMVVHPNLY